MAVCRSCRRPFAPARPWFHTCPLCFVKPGQLTIFDALPREAEPEEPSEFIAWLDANPLAGTLAA